jgi:hypothetical protein
MAEILERFKIRQEKRGFFVDNLSRIDQAGRPMKVKAAKNDWLDTTKSQKRL